MATRCDGGGSTSLTSSVRASPNVRPHWPQMADAERELGAERIDGPRVGAADGGRAARGHPHDERTQSGTQTADGADGRRARSEHADHLRLAPAIAQDDRSADLGLDRAFDHERMVRSTSSMTSRKGALAQQRMPAYGRAHGDGCERETAAGRRCVHRARSATRPRSPRSPSRPGPSSGTASTTRSASGSSYGASGGPSMRIGWRSLERRVRAGHVDDQAGSVAQVDPAHVDGQSRTPACSLRHELDPTGREALEPAGLWHDAAPRERPVLPR